MLLEGVCRHRTGVEQSQSPRRPSSVFHCERKRRQRGCDRLPRHVGNFRYSFPPRARWRRCRSSATIYSSGDILEHTTICRRLSKRLSSAVRRCEWWRPPSFCLLSNAPHSSEIASGRRMLYWVMAGMALLVIVLLLMLLFCASRDG